MAILEKGSNFPEEGTLAERIEWLIRDEMQYRYTSTIKMNDEMRIRIKELEDKLFELQREKNFSEHRLLSDISKAKREEEDRVLRSLTGGFRIGDQFWICDTTGEFVTCPDCLGEKQYEIEVPRPNAEIKRAFLPCPKCRGIGKITKFTDKPLRVYAESFELRKDGENMILMWNSRISKGVLAEECYKTREECQTACDLTNEKRGKKNDRA